MISVTHQANGKNSLGDICVGRGSKDCEEDRRGDGSEIVAFVRRRHIMSPLRSTWRRCVVEYRCRFVSRSDKFPPARLSSLKNEGWRGSAFVVVDKSHRQTEKRQ